MGSFPKVLPTLPFLWTLRVSRNCRLYCEQLSRAENCSVIALSGIRAIMLKSGLSLPYMLHDVPKLPLSLNEWSPMKHDLSSSNSQRQTCTEEHKNTHTHTPEFAHIETHRSETGKSAGNCCVCLILQKNSLVDFSVTNNKRVGSFSCCKPLYHKFLETLFHKALPLFWLWEKRFSRLHSIFRALNGCDILHGFVLLMEARTKWS